MPLVAVAGALFAGTTIATVGIAAMSTFAVISAVGAIAAGIGVVTGNKALTSIGALASLAGGIGAFAQSSGWLAAGEVAADKLGGAGAAGAAPEAGSIANSLADQSNVVTDASASLAGANDTSSLDYVNSMDAASDAVQAAGTTVAPSAAPPGLINNADTVAESARYGYDKMNMTPESLQALRSEPTSTSSSIFGVLNDVGGYLEKNKTLASLGGNFIGGMFDDKKKAEAKQASAAAELYAQRAALERQQAINGNTVPDLTGLKINPNVNVYNTGASPTYLGPRVGLLNSTGR